MLNQLTPSQISETGFPDTPVYSFVYDTSKRLISFESGAFVGYGSNGKWFNDCQIMISNFDSVVITEQDCTPVLTYSGDYALREVCEFEYTDQVIVLRGFTVGRGLWTEFKIFRGKIEISYIEMMFLLRSPNHKRFLQLVLTEQSDLNDRRSYGFKCWMVSNETELQQRHIWLYEGDLLTFVDEMRQLFLHSKRFDLNPHDVFLNSISDFSFRVSARSACQRFAVEVQLHSSEHPTGTSVVSAATKIFLVSFIDRLCEIVPRLSDDAPKSSRRPLNLADTTYYGLLVQRG